jgi:hypothetical protein
MFEVSAFEARTLSWWFDKKDDIELDPPYQRRANLWSITDRQFLIDSILNGYDVPKLYIADFTFGPTTLKSGRKQYAVIDGKQRFGAIFDFFDNKLSLAPTFEWTSDHSARLGGLLYSDLVRNHPKAASRFTNFNLSVMRVITDDEAKINELFVRLNRSKPLTGAEIRNAMGGVVPELIRTIAEHVFFQTNTRFATTRRQDLNAAAKLLLIEFRGQPVGTQKPNIDRFVREGTDAEAKPSEFERASQRVARVLDRMSEIFGQRDSLLRSAGPLPVYYWFIRECPPSIDPIVRSFLLAFERARKRNKQLASEGARLVDPELVLYEKFDRSTDNQGSIEGRVEILTRRLKDFQDPQETSQQLR